MSKCICGYDCRLPGEQEMLDQYGCARTLVKREGPFNSLSVVMCSRDNLPPEMPVSDDQSFADAFLAKHRKDGNNNKG